MSRDHGVGRLVGRMPVGGGLVQHEIAPPVELAETYRTPGQYVDVRVDGKSTYFVIANPTSLTHWELLVRPGGDVADALLRVPVGAPVELSHALGSGFPVDEANARRLLVFATGSGIAALRAVVAQRIRTGQAGATEAFLGVRLRTELPIAHDLAAWRDSGVAVTVCLSRERVELPGFAGGYVQDALRLRGEGSPPLQGAMIFAAGTSQMIDVVRTVAGSLGVGASDVRTNY